MDAIEKGVNEVGKKGSRLGYMRIDGKTPAKQRDANVTRFQEDHSCKVREQLCGMLVRHPVHMCWPHTTSQDMQGCVGDMICSR